MSKLAAIIGRLCIAVLFIWSGASKFMDLSGTNAMMVAAGLPSGLALAAAIFEVLAGLFLALGFIVRFVSVLLAGYVALTILFFHNRFYDPAVLAEALKNLAIIGGLALSFAHSQIWHSYYSIRGERRALLRTHDAELRAARAEGDAAAARAAAPARTAAVDTDGDGVADTRVAAAPVRRRRWFDW